MKKSLLNYKSLNYAFLLLLLCANSMYSQTLLTETFGTAVNAAYTGATSTPSLSYTQSGGGLASTAVIGTGTDAYLNLITNAVTPAVGTRATLSGTLPTGNGFSPILTDNTNLVTWTVNIKANQLGSNASTSYALGKKFVSVVLCASNAGILGNVPPTLSDGYALMYQKNNIDGAKASISLIKFHNGIGNSSTTADAQELCVITRLIESPALTAIPATSTYAALSVKVVYDPRVDSWELYYREDAATAPFVDPTTGTLLLANTGTVTDATYTSTTMTNFGFISGALLNNSVKSQFDNFKIALSTLPPLPPTTERRQSFNSTPTPKVSDLVAEGIVGATFNWYAAPTGGSLLSPTTPLTYANYYVSQTVLGAESTRVASQVFVGDTALKTLPLYEGFANYNISDKLIIMNNSAADGIGLGSWTITPGTNTNDDVTIVASPTWTTNLTATSGNAITFAGSGIDPELKFTDTTSGSLYSSFLFTATDAASIVSATDAAAAANPPTTVQPGVDPDKSTPTGIYSFLSQSNTGGVRYSASVMFRKVFGTPNKFNIGLSKSDNAAECTWSSTDYDFGTQYLIMISYENIGDADSLNQVANLWVNPTTTTLPIPVPTLTQNNPTTSISRDNIDRIKILQVSTSSTPLTIIDEIRVANNWGQALGAEATLGITTVKNTGFKMYPNPVSNGKLYISSSTNLEKEVIIFNTLGQRVLQTKTVSEEAINVSNLNKGTYFVKITEAGITATKKLIIQ